MAGEAGMEDANITADYEMDNYDVYAEEGDYSLVSAAEAACHQRRLAWDLGNRTHCPPFWDK